MELAKKLNCADEYVELSRTDPSKQWAAIKEKYPYGFDVVVEASGSHKMLTIGLDNVTRGGKLVYYGQSHSPLPAPHSKSLRPSLTQIPK